jgi:hypothetical protein
MALTSPAGPNEFHLKGLLTFYVTFRPYLVKIYRLSFSSLAHSKIYFMFTPYNRTAQQYQHEIISSCQRHVVTSHKKAQNKIRYY